MIELVPIHKHSAYSSFWNGYVLYKRCIVCHATKRVNNV